MTLKEQFKDDPLSFIMVLSVSICLSLLSLSAFALFCLKMFSNVPTIRIL